MNCREAQQKLLESFESALSSDARRDLERHLAACHNCAEFGGLLNRIDVQLRDVIRAPRLSPGFRRALQARIDRQPPALWKHWLPEVAYLAGSGAALLGCVLLLPFSASSVVWLVGLIAAIGYSFQTLLVSSLEEL